MKRLLLFLVLPCLLAVGCAKGHFSQGENAAEANVFRYPLAAKPTTMDPGKVEDGDTIDVLQQVYEGLVGWGQDNKVHPRLATGWEIKNGGRTYIFHIRTDAKFSNGRPVTAEDFKWCLERNCNPALASVTAPEYMSDIVGVMDVVNGKSKTISGMKVLDPHTLEIDIDAPRPYFLGKLTYPVAYVFAKEAIKDPSKELTDAAEMIGTGPFKFQTVNVDQVVTMVANDGYYLGRPKIDKIERPYVGDAATRLAMFEQGNLDLVQIDRQDVLNVEKDPKLKADLRFFDRPSIWYIGINCGVVPALRDRRVRRAIAMAINKDNICKNVLGGINPEADCILPPNVFGHQAHADAIQYNPTEAKALLAQAGYPNGQGFPPLVMYYRNNMPDIQIVANAVGQDLQQNLNIKTSFQATEWAQYLAMYDKSQIPFFHMRWGADYLDAQNFLSNLLSSTGEENRINYHNKQFDALCAKADSSQNPAERLKLYGQAENIALQDAAFIPIYFQRDAELISPRVHDIRECTFGHLPHTRLSLK